MQEVKTAAAYIRVSTEDQAELSPESQLQVIRDFARKNGYFIPEQFIFRDEGISGRKAAKRPGFNAMVAACRERENDIDAVLVWKFSRFARNQEESIVYKAMLKKDGVDVVSVSEPLIEGPFGSLIERILEWMDEYYSIRLSGEVKRSMTVKAQKGGRQIAPPFGYRLETTDHGRVMVPHETEADLVRELYRRFLNGEGMFTLARDFNSRGIRTHRGGGFHMQAIEYILRNPVYIGKLRWTPTGRNHHTFAVADTIVADAEHAPILDVETWNAVQARMLAVKEQYPYKARPVHELKDWLSGIVRCASCGTTLVYQKPHYFKCNNYVHGKCKSSQHISAARLHEAVLENLRAVADGDILPDYEITVTDTAEDDRQRIEQALEALDRRLDRMRESYAAGIDTLDDYRDFKRRNDVERAELLERLETMKHGNDPGAAVDAVRKAVQDAVGLLEDATVDVETKNKIVRSVIKECVFDKSTMKLRIMYRFIL